jgi:hypothetical protein
MIAVLHESFLPIGNEYKSISDYNKYLKMQILFYKYQIVFKSNHREPKRWSVLVLYIFQFIYFSVIAF